MKLRHLRDNLVNKSYWNVENLFIIKMFSKQTVLEITRLPENMPEIEWRVLISCTETFAGIKL